MALVKVLIINIDPVVSEATIVEISGKSLNKWATDVLNQATDTQ
jgi:predicted HicB family RNase H-like nuclease